MLANPNGLLEETDFQGELFAKPFNEALLMLEELSIVVANNDYKNKLGKKVSLFDKEHIGNLIGELRDYGFKPSEDIVSTDSKNGLPTVDGPEALNEVKKKCPNIGEFIEKVEADYENEYVASLSGEERVRYILIKQNPELEGKI